MTEGQQQRAIGQMYEICGRLGIDFDSCDADEAYQALAMYARELHLTTAEYEACEAAIDDRLGGWSRDTRDERNGR